MSRFRLRIVLPYRSCLGPNSEIIGAIPLVLVNPRFIWVVLFLNLTALGTETHAQYLSIYGGPNYNSLSGNGYRNQFSSIRANASNGIAAGSAWRSDAGVDTGTRAIRLDSSGTAIELGNLGTDISGLTTTEAWGANTFGTIVGSANKYVGDINKGSRPVRWDASGVAIELSNLGLDSQGVTSGRAEAINNNGTIVGWYSSSSGNYTRVVRWDFSGNVTELGSLGFAFPVYCFPTAINSAGTAIGRNGEFAVRWGASGTAVTKLDGLSTSRNVEALDINDFGTVLGGADKYVNGLFRGHRALRWEAGATVATELSNLDALEAGSGYPYDINGSGTAVGWSDKFVANTYKGERAVRWDASRVTATELGNLGTDVSGATISHAVAINDLSIIVGYAKKYDGLGNFLSQRAVLWGLDGIAIDLNTLIDPSSGWQNLSIASGISNDNWITGTGSFDPDGPGGLSAYNRLFLMQIPEPALLSLVVSSVLLTFMRIRQKSLRNITDADSRTSL